MAKTYLIPAGTIVEVVSGSVTLVITDCDESTMSSSMSGGGECRGGCRGIGRSLEGVEGLPCDPDVLSMCFVPQLLQGSTFTTTMAATCLISSATLAECAEVKLTRGDQSVTLRIPRGENSAALDDPYCAGSDG